MANFRSRYKMTKPNAWIGVDPGARGALCIIIDREGSKADVHFLDNKMDNRAINLWLSSAAEELNIKMAMIEDIHSLFGVSSKANFGLGRELGRMNALLSIQEFGLDLVAPKIWQKAVGVKLPVKKKGAKPVKSNPIIKKEVERLCNQLYPGCNIYGPKGGLWDGRSDSLMLCHYTRCKYK